MEWSFYAIVCFVIAMNYMYKCDYTFVTIVISLFLC